MNNYIPTIQGTLHLYHSIPSFVLYVKASIIRNHFPQAFLRPSIRVILFNPGFNQCPTSASTKKLKQRKLCITKASSRKREQS